MITLQFAAEANIPSLLIEWYGHGSYAHVDNVCEDGTLLGARVKGGVQKRLPGYAPFTKILRVTLPFQATDYDKFLNDQIGKPYDGTAIAAFAFDRDWRKADSWFCSELIAAALEACNFFRYPLVTAANKLTPPDLLLLCSAFVSINKPSVTQT
jgi:hypothetical protein